jgi:peptide/nickel transport system permease protein
MGTRKAFLYIIFRTTKLLSLLVTVSLVSFILVSFSPIDPIQSYIGADTLLVGNEQRESIAEHWGLDQSRAKQYSIWLMSLLKGDLGTSMIYRMPVVEILHNRFIASIILMITAWLISGAMGFILGALAGMNRGTWIDRLIKWYSFTLASTPSFWIGLIMLMVFSVYLGWFPVGLGSPIGMVEEDVSLWNKFTHLILPALTLSIVGTANIALYTRQKLIEILDSEYIHYAKTKGETGITLFLRHGMRNVSLPAVSLHFASFGELLGGTILAEQIFSYPGLGKATVEAGLRGDIPLLLGIVLFSTIFVFFGNLFADLLYKVIDPRIRNEVSI